jgi:molybdopterin-guanine dinucleotide biosynthesis protein MobB
MPDASAKGDGAPPMLSVVGRKHAGKTTLVVRLSQELTRRGHRVMVLKHGTHTFNLDPEATDTYRHYHEGNAERVAMASPDKFALIERWGEERSAEEIAERHMSDADVVVCEGFKRSALPKIEIHRREAHDAPLYGGTEIDSSTVRLLVTDAQSLGAVPVIRLDSAGWLESLADFVERDIMQGGA